MKNGKNIICLAGSCQALKRREFFCLDFSGKGLKDQGVTSFDAAYQVSGKSSHELQIKMPRNCKDLAHPLIIFQALIRIKTFNPFPPQSALVKLLGLTLNQG